MSHKIYIIEDHPVMRDAYVSFLEAAPGLDLCGTAESAEEVLDQLAELDCDLVVTDYRLPGLNGADLVRRLREVRPDLPAIVVSGHEDDAFAREALEAGAVAFLKKRTLVDQLIPTIHAVLAERHLDAA
ncbi:MAG TPA: response regulator transcription factor [Rubricoccaceae bacterium]